MPRGHKGEPPANKFIPTEEQKKWLRENYPVSKNEEVMACLGVSFGTMQRVRREMGLKKSPGFMRECQLAASRAAKASHLANGTYPRKGFQIPGSSRHRFQRGVTSLMRLGPEREAERVRKSAETRRKTLAAERRRVLFGMEQKTRLKIGHSRTKSAYRCKMRRMGYVIERGGWMAVATAATRRSPLVEKSAARYGIRVILQDQSGKEPNQTSQAV